MRWRDEYIEYCYFLIEEFISSGRAISNCYVVSSHDVSEYEDEKHLQSGLLDGLIYALQNENGTEKVIELKEESLVRTFPFGFKLCVGIERDNLNSYFVMRLSR